jgi:PhnB protein
MSTVQPYLFFEGRAEEAAEFYAKVLGAQLEMLMRYDESPDPVPEGMVPPGSGRKVMHMSLRIGETVVMGSDGNCSGKPGFGGFSLAHTVATEADAERVFDQLAAGGRVEMPLAQTFFATKFGMLADKFGVGWMVLVDTPMPAAA